MATIACVNDLGQLEQNAQNTTLAVGANTVTGANDKTLLLFKNSNAASRTVTVTANKTSFRAGTHGSIAISDVTITVPGSATAGGMCAISVPGVDYISGSTITLTGDANAADVTCSAWSLEQRS